MGWNRRSGNWIACGAIVGLGVALALTADISFAAGWAGEYPTEKLERAREQLNGDLMARLDAIGDLELGRPFGGETPEAFDLLIGTLAREQDANVLLFLYPALTSRARYFGRLARDPDFLRSEQTNSVEKFGKEWRFPRQDVDRWVPALELIASEGRDSQRSKALGLIDHLEDPPRRFGTRTRALLTDADPCTRTAAGYLLIEYDSPYARRAAQVLESSESKCFEGREELAPGRVIQSLAAGRCPEGLRGTALEILCLSESPLPAMLPPAGGSAPPKGMAGGRAAHDKPTGLVACEIGGRLEVRRRGECP